MTFFPLPIIELQKFIDGVYKEAKVAKYKLLHSTRVKLGYQNRMRKFQNDVIMTTLNNNSFDNENCAYCKYYFVIHIGLDINEITKYNGQVSEAPQQ